MPDKPSPNSTSNGLSRGTWGATIIAALKGDDVARRSLRHTVYQIIEVGRGDDRRSKLFDAFIVTLILLNIAAFMAETVKSIHDAYGAWLWAFEVFSVGIFTLEYLARLWTAVEVPFLAKLGPWKARIKLARRGGLIIDLLAILPFYLAMILTIDLRDTVAYSAKTEHPK